MSPSLDAFEFKTFFMIHVSCYIAWFFPIVLLLEPGGAQGWGGGAGGAGGGGGGGGGGPLLLRTCLIKLQAEFLQLYQEEFPMHVFS